MFQIYLVSVALPYGLLVATSNLLTASRMEIERLDAIGYPSNFLKQVIFRLDFPPILAIHNPPDRFQADLRHDFPLLRKEVTEIKIGERSVEERVVWMFVSLDEKKVISVSPDYVGVDFNGCYSTFEEYRELVERVLGGFVEAYDRISLINRIGLRYINEIKLPNGSALEWKGLINPALLGHLSFRPEGTRYARIMSQAIEKTEEYDLSLTYGLPNNREFPGEIVRRMFLLDIDCYRKGVETEPDVLETLDGFHHAIQGLFEESIEQGLRDILEQGG